MLTFDTKWLPHNTNISGRGIRAKNDKGLINIYHFSGYFAEFLYAITEHPTRSWVFLEVKQSLISKKISEVLRVPTLQRVSL